MMFRKEERAGPCCTLVALTEGESFDIVLATAPSGLEALRRLVRRWDLLSEVKRRALLRQFLVPDRCKVQDLPAGLEKMGRTGLTETRGANRVEQRQQPLVRTSRQPHLKP